MKIITLISFIILSVCIHAKAQQVEVFEGRGQTSSTQLIMDYSYQNLEKVPVGGNNADIQVLILDNNKLTELPNWISNLTNLKILSVRNNNLREVSSLLSHCTQLEQVYFSGNPNLDHLPNLSSCRNLMLVDVVGTKITDIPVHIRTMDHLYYFKYTPQK